MFDIAQILYKEGMKCTQEKARDRPKMKEVVGHIICVGPFPCQVYEELLRCESHSPTPYELQIKFDSTERNPFVAQATVQEKLRDEEGLLSSHNNKSSRINSNSNMVNISLLKLYQPSCLVFQFQPFQIRLLKMKRRC